MELFFIFILMETGKLLVATPAVMGDFNFHRSVVLLTDTKKSGAVGFILNKKLDYTLDEVMDGIESKLPLFFGGPVEQDNLFFVHTLGKQVPKSIAIGKTLYWNGDFKVVNQLLKSGKLNNDNIRFFLGYSGWTADQLESELKEKSWEPFDLNAPVELLKMDTESMWRDCMTTLGGDYLLWSNTPENPRAN